MLVTAAAATGSAARATRASAASRHERLPAPAPRALPPPLPAPAPPRTPTAPRHAARTVAEAAAKTSCSADNHPQSLPRAAGLLGSDAALAAVEPGRADIHWQRPSARRFADAPPTCCAGARGRAAGRLARRRCATTGDASHDPIAASAAREPQTAHTSQPAALPAAETASMPLGAPVSGVVPASSSSAVTTAAASVHDCCCCSRLWGAAVAPAAPASGKGASGAIEGPATNVHSLQPIGEWVGTAGGRRKRDDGVAQAECRTHRHRPSLLRCAERRWRHRAVCRPLPQQSGECAGHFGGRASSRMRCRRNQRLDASAGRWLAPGVRGFSAWPPAAAASPTAVRKAMRARSRPFPRRHSPVSHRNRGRNPEGRRVRQQGFRFDDGGRGAVGRNRAGGRVKRQLEGKEPVAAERPRGRPPGGGWPATHECKMPT